MTALAGLALALLLIDATAPGRNPAPVAVTIFGGLIECDLADPS
jgi:hypothetical protein